MASIDYWAEVPMQREQIALFSPTLDSAIGDDDPVRLFDEVLAGIDWSQWEAEYHGRVGQPPIHPRQLAAAILYGLYRRIRSSRQLEEATHYRLDFMWLLHGRRIDHTALAKFRTKFRKPLKGLFRQIGRMAMTLGLVRLCEVAFDGTRVKASNSRDATRTAKRLEEQLVALDELFEQMMAELDCNDASQKTLDGQDDSPAQLPLSLANLKRRRQLVRDALAHAQASLVDGLRACERIPDSSSRPDGSVASASQIVCRSRRSKMGGFFGRREIRMRILRLSWPPQAAQRLDHLAGSCFTALANGDRKFSSTQTSRLTGSRLPTKAICRPLG